MRVEQSILFENVIFPPPYAIFETADLKKVQEHFLDQGLIPIIQTFDKESEMFIGIDKLPKPPNVTFIKSLVVCIMYNENFKC